MSLTLEQLDSEGRDSNVTILVGKNLLLKFTPGDSIFESEKSLQELIKTSDLLSSDILLKIMEEKKLSEEISKKLSDGIRFQEEFAKFRGDEVFQSVIKKNLEKIREEVITKNIKIKNIEKETKFYLAKDYPLYFCRNCVSYLANSTESLPANCKFCGQKTEEDKQIFTRFSDEKIISYLNGFWLEDYIARILRSIGWKTWCHGSVMGSSGISHPVDILAISLGRVLVGECKSGAFGTKDIFNFAAQYFDIKCSYGFFFALKEKPDSRGKDYMERTPGLCLLDNLENLTDEKIVKKIEEHIKFL